MPRLTIGRVILIIGKLFLFVLNIEFRWLKKIICLKVFLVLDSAVHFVKETVIMRQ